MSSSSKHALSVCFVALNTYSLFNKATNYKIGGSEVRTYLFTKGLAQKPNYNVTCVVMDYGQPKSEKYEGVQLYKHSYYKHASLSTSVTTTGFGAALWSGFSEFSQHQYDKIKPHMVELSHFPFRWVRPLPLLNWPRALLVSLYVLIIKWQQILQNLLNMLDKISRNTIANIDGHIVYNRQIRSYQQVDADIYCAINISKKTAEVIAYCQHAGKTSVLISGHDRNFSETYLPEAGGDEYGTDSAIGYYSVTHADYLVAQTQKQADMLQKNYGREAVVIPNPFEFDTLVEDVPPYPERKTIFWVGRPPDSLKRPALILKLARAFPDLPFVLVYRTPDHVEGRGQFKALRDQIPDNVTLHNRVPFHEIDNLYAQAAVLVNTSTSEGFPNTFLQAGKYGVPVLSLSVDPEEMLTQAGCGIYAEDDFDAFKAGLQELLDDQQGAQHYSHNIYQYVREKHDMGPVITKLDKFLRDVVSVRDT